MGFLEEPLLGRGVPRQVWRQEFDGDRALETWVARFIDDAHAAAAQLAHDLIGTERSSRGQGHARGKYIAGLTVQRVALGKCEMDLSQLVMAKNAWWDHDGHRPQAVYVPRSVVARAITCYL